MSLIIAIIGYLMLAVVSIQDKFLLSAKKLPPAVFVFYTNFFSFFVIPFLFFGVKFPSSPLLWGLVVASGVALSLSLWTMYIAIERSEISHIGPFLGATTPIFVLIFSSSYLGEKFTTAEFLAIFLLAFGSLIISFKRTGKRINWSKGLGWAILSAVFAGITHVSAKAVYISSDFYSGFILTRTVQTLFGASLLFLPSVRREFFNLRHPSKQINSGSRGRLFTVIFNSILGALGNIFIQYAIAIGSVTIVNSLLGFQYAALVIIVALLSKIIPRVFREKYQRGEVLQEIIAVCIIGIGLYFLI